MRHEGSSSLFQYWNRLRGKRQVPKRTEIEPADIKQLLADTFILEQDSRGEAVFRLAGTRLCATYGRELKGFAFASLWATRDRRVMSRLAYGALHNKSVVVVGFEGVSRAGRLNPFELLLLPLDGGIENPRALGSIASMEKPFWLGADPIEENRIENLRVVDPDREPTFPGSRMTLAVPPLDTAAGQATAENDRRATAGRRFRHLVVFEGGRDE